MYSHAQNFTLVLWSGNIKVAYDSLPDFPCHALFWREKQPNNQTFLNVYIIDYYCC